MATSARLLDLNNSLLNLYPVVNYQGIDIGNLTVKLKLTEIVTKNRLLYFTHLITEDQQRPDILAKTYYGDSKYDWVILLVNQVIDPFFEWPLSIQTFKQFIIDKYQSEAIATSTIHNYNLTVPQINQISVPEYNALSAELKKYWEPNTNYLGELIGYKFTTQELELSIGGYNLLSLAEKQYWQAVSKYDYEQRLNDNKRVIKVLNKKYLSSFVTQIKQVLK